MLVHEIAADEAGNWHGTDGTVKTTLIGDGRMFKRRAIKNAGSETAHEVCWLVTELNGVFVYQSGNNIIVTAQEMYP